MQWSWITSVGPKTTEGCPCRNGSVRGGSHGEGGEDHRAASRQGPRATWGQGGQGGSSCGAQSMAPGGGLPAWGRRVPGLCG